MECRNINHSEELSQTMEISRLMLNAVCRMMASISNNSSQFVLICTCQSVLSDESQVLVDMLRLENYCRRSCCVWISIYWMFKRFFRGRKLCVYIWMPDLTGKISWVMQPITSHSVISKTIHLLHVFNEPFSLFTIDIVLLLFYRKFYQPLLTSHL